MPPAALPAWQGGARFWGLQGQPVCACLCATSAEIRASLACSRAVLHLIAMARAAGVDLTIDDFQRVSDRTPFLADFKPSGKYVMEDLHAVRVVGRPCTVSASIRGGPRRAPGKDVMEVLHALSLSLGMARLSGTVGRCPVSRRGRQVCDVTQRAGRDEGATPRDAGLGLPLSGRRGQQRAV